MVTQGVWYRRVSVLLASAWCLAWCVPCHAQEAGRVTVQVRPQRVRVGSTFVVTVRIAGPGRPDALELGATERAELVDVRERSSWAVGPGRGEAVTEADFVMRARAPGRVAPAEAWAIVAGDTLRASVPEVEAIAAPLAVQEAPPSRGREPDLSQRIRDDGEPPEGTGRSGAHPMPWGGYPYAPGTAGPAASSLPGAAGTEYAPQPYGPAGWPAANPYGPTGWGTASPGRGWAATADGDPAWYDLIPRLDRYQSRAVDPRGLVTLEAGLTPDRVYVGQQATLVTTASFTPEALPRLAQSPEIFPPAGAQAWTVEIPYAPPSPAAVGGRIQEAHTLMRAYFPLAPGRLELEGVRLRYGVGSGGASHAPGEELVTGRLGVEVLPVPRQGAPPGWGGAVGRFRVAAWIEPEAVGWGEAAYLTVEVAGAGNVRTLARPDPGAIWGAEVRAVGERAMVEVRDGVVGGVKTFTWLVVPLEAAPVRIGPVIFPFFDPWVEAFGQVASGEVVLDARPVGSVWNPGPGDTMDAAPAWTPPWERELPSEGSTEWPPDDLDDASPAPGAAPLPRDRATDETPRGNEATAHAALEALHLSPGEPMLWLRLAEAYRAGRPGEGWAEWALLNGLLRAPRHEGLRVALWGDGRWRGRNAGLQIVPLSPWESGAAATALAVPGIALLAWSLLRRGRGSGLRSAWAAALLGAGAVGIGEPWVRHRFGAEPGVVVEGSAPLRAEPSWNAPASGALPAGAVVHLGARFGGWVEVGRERGAEGWSETARVLPLEPGVAR